MVQFLSIIFFSWISSIFVGFFKSSFFCVTLYLLLINCSEEFSCNTLPNCLGNALHAMTWTKGIVHVRWTKNM